MCKTFNKSKIIPAVKLLQSQQKSSRRNLYDRPASVNGMDERRNAERCNMVCMKLSECQVCFKFFIYMHTKRTSKTDDFVCAQSTYKHTCRMCKTFEILPKNTACDRKKIQVCEFQICKVCKSDECRVSLEKGNVALTHTHASSYIKFEKYFVCKTYKWKASINSGIVEVEDKKKHREIFHFNVNIVSNMAQ